MADFHYSYIVCECKKVTLGEIIYAIKEKKCHTVESIGNLTDAGTACGCCKSEECDFGDPKMKLYIEQIIRKFN